MILVKVIKGLKERCSEQPEPQFFHADDRRAAGKALRDTVPREAHGYWEVPKDRRHIVDLIEQSNRGWMETLVPIRHGRMMESPFTFYRGSAAVMAADPPLIFHPTAELAAGVETGYREAFAQHREIAG